MAKSTRVRSPLMSAFRSAYEKRDSKVRVDERDESGERVLAGRRSVARSSMSPSDLQRDLSRDLETLMNTVNLGAALDLTGQTEVERSILNYGFPDIVHRTIDEIATNDIGYEIEAALATFEPRLIRDSILVRRDDTVEARELKIRFIVRADIDCDPLNIPVEFVADLERDTGKIVISRS